VARRCQGELHRAGRDEFVAAAAACWRDPAHAAHAGHPRRDAAITRGITTLAALAEYFSEDKRYPGWVELNWSRPTGAALDKWWNS
jgi:prolyl-tRNA synthetase